jgi:hypothetical protein
MSTVKKEWTTKKKKNNVDGDETRDLKGDEMAGVSRLAK